MKLKYINIIIVTLILFATSACKVKPTEKNIQNAEVNIPNIEQNKLYSLDGDWEFYNKQFIAPESFKNYSTDSIKYLTISNKRQKHKLDGKELTPIGYETYHLRLIMPQQRGLYALQIPKVYSAYKLWFNERLLLTKGQTGTSEETSKALIEPVLVPINIAKDTNDIVIQVSNFQTEEDFGISTPILIGNVDTIRQNEKKSYMYLFVFLGAYLLTIGYFVITSIFYSKNRRTNIYFSIVTFTFIAFQLTHGNMYIYSIFPNLPWKTFTIIDYLSNYLSVAFGFWFLYYLFLKEKIYNKRFVDIASGLLMVMAAAHFFIPTIYFPKLLYVFIIIMSITNTYTLLVVGKLALQNNRKAKLLMLAFVLFFASVLNEILLFYGLVNTVSFLNVGTLFYVIIYSTILSIYTFFIKDKHKSNELNIKTIDKIKERFFAVRSFDLLKLMRILSEELNINTICIFIEIDDKLKCEATYNSGNEKISYLRNPIECEISTSFFDQFENNKENIIINEDNLIYKIEEKNGHKKFLYFLGTNDTELTVNVMKIMEYEISLVIENYITYYKEENININFDDILNKRISQIKSQKEELLEQENTLAIKLQEIVISKQKVDELNKISTTKNKTLHQNIENIEKLNAKISEQKDIINQNLRVVNENLKYSKILHQILIGIISRSLRISYFQHSSPKRIISGDFLFVQQLKDRLLILLIDMHYRDTIALFFTSYVYALLGDIIIIENKPLMDNLDKFIKMLKTNYLQVFSYETNLKDFGFFVSTIKSNGLMNYCSEDTIAYIVSDNQINDISSNKERMFNTKTTDLVLANYVQKEVKLNNRDRLYLQTDGFLKQKRASDNERFGYERLEQLILELAKYEITENKEIVEKVFAEWKKETKQEDDYLIFGYDFVE